MVNVKDVTTLAVVWIEMQIASDPASKNNVTTLAVVWIEIATASSGTR